MFALIKYRRRRKRVWKVLRSHNPELTKDTFDAAYQHIDYMMRAVAGKN